MSSVCLRTIVYVGHLYVGDICLSVTIVDTSIIFNQNDDIVIVIAVLINISIVDVCLLPLQICFVLLTIITNLIIVSIIAIICVGPILDDRLKKNS